MKHFISQPMKGKTNEEIKAERENLVAEIKGRDENAEIIESFFEDAPHDANPLWFLGKSIQKLSCADVLHCAKGWNEARGCVIEHDCAVAYGIEVVEHYD